MSQTALNLASAVNVAKTQTGLAGVPPATWTYDQRATYNVALARIIAENPDRFESGHVVHATSVVIGGYEALEDTGFDFAMFADEVGTQAAKFGFSVSTAVVAGLILYVFGPKIRKALA